MQHPSCQRYGPIHVSYQRTFWTSLEGSGRRCVQPHVQEQAHCAWQSRAHFSPIHFSFGMLAAISVDYISKTVATSNEYDFSSQIGFEPGEIAKYIDTIIEYSIDEHVVMLPIKYLLYNVRSSGTIGSG